ncbi:hypothetical protein C2W62_39695 [Candidatus Entotheonella serta]|nr:hypothetical protein C2W62_39695 [Candidatus Entotheonella serta]
MLDLLSRTVIPAWKRLGRSYYLLIISTLIAVIALSLSQLLGHAWQHPRLITLLGLRAPFLLATVLFPIIAWRLLDDLGESALIRRFLAAFIILMMFRGTPYGLDKWPFLFWGGLRLLNSYQRQERTWLPYVESGLVILLGLWLAIWFLRLIESPFLIDPGPDLKWIDRWIVLVGAGFVALAPSFHRLVSRQRQGYTIGVWLLILLFLAGTTKRAVSLHHEWQHGRLQDLYNAQLWANTHTRPEDAFIVPGGAWRSFSERRTFVPRPQGYHFYHPDRRIKAFDDRIYLFRDVGRLYTIPTRRNPRQNFSGL